MTDVLLGNLNRVDLREIWTSEASSFTPWLARPENLEKLGNAIGIDLELEAQERAVGPFRADILCKDRGADTWVLIENQLERTDHGHLGQLLTYASGLDAVTVVWIAANFTEEHRATLDWLNKITDESFRFFGLEVELWRIEDSPAAPKFNIISKPNNWSHSIKEGARAIEEAELSEIRIMQRDYWDGLNRVLQETRGPIAGNRKPQPQSWMSHPIGRSYFHLNVVMIRPKEQVRAELFIAGDNAKAYYRLLANQRTAIEEELGYPLEWEELPDAQGSRITTCLENVNPDDKSDWQRQHEWLAGRLNDLHRAFSQRVRDLDLDDVQTDRDGASSPNGSMIEGRASI